MTDDVYRVINGSSNMHVYNMYTVHNAYRTHVYNNRHALYMVYSTHCILYIKYLTSYSVQCTLYNIKHICQ